MESSKQQSKDFIDILKDFLNKTIHKLQLEEKIPPLAWGSKPNSPKGKKVSFKGKVPEINWEFDAKDTNWTKYGNFSSHTLLKLISKYKKMKGVENTEEIDGVQVAEIVV